MPGNGVADVMSLLLSMRKKLVLIRNQALDPDTQSLQQPHRFLMPFKEMGEGNAPSRLYRGLAEWPRVTRTSSVNGTNTRLTGSWWNNITRKNSK